MKHETLTGYDFTVDNALRPRAAMRKKCLECATTSENVRKCHIVDCALWPYRMGKGVTKDPEGRELIKQKTGHNHGFGKK